MADKFTIADLEQRVNDRAKAPRRGVLYAQAARQGRGAVRQEIRRGGGRGRARRGRRGPRTR